MSEKKETLFGVGLDKLAREHGGWPHGAIVHGVEAIGSGDKKSVLMLGAVPIGHRPDGRPRFDKSQRGDLKAVCQLAEYRTAFAPSDLAERERS